MLKHSQFGGLIFLVEMRRLEGTRNIGAGHFHKLFDQWELLIGPNVTVSLPKSG